MKHLIIYAHPNQESLNGQVKQCIEKTLKQHKHEVVVRDLYQLEFDPVLSLEDMTGQRNGTVDKLIEKEQEYISWADVVTFIYPIWWTGMPAIMKGYIDRVFSYGFAYRYDQGIQKGLLTGKQAIILNTHGKSHEEYSAIGMDKALSLTSDKGIYTYCGFQIQEHFFFDKADRATPEAVAVWLSKISNLYTIN
ncbi:MULTISPECIES: NAD(P)H-dependent oxidoreductase [unclassified Chryseobacterium]|uniref:NAD(P)H-dependent oxidoreductase n=1 Tax=unclassified Chryseobacterium TaxID=2593645 RepID=UPI00100A92AE|nr:MULTISPECIES: NAD(P)H-dependent oxidoreductase [unclassified Chryseobacterium]RXM51719.1 NAD(P)H dehydrogenase [Chryseobacterium sp. CH25]RXM67297.1 NAD(P)H dehydrogenase [Chryseobacterium sp. CH1]